MNAQECLQILRDVKDVAFATVDDKGCPKVRIIDVMLVERGKLYFCTARGKDFYRQLMENGRVAITGLNTRFQMVRLEGRAVRLSEQKMWIDQIFKENPSMNDVYPGESRYILESFCVDNGQLEFFDLGKSPIERSGFALADETVPEKGFQITDGCIGCGLCHQNCPQQCIYPGEELADGLQTPYVIRQENCLHCGLCAENCPVLAIERRGESL